jgi:Arc/MetJ-type ribon-helix-helix transcriptional regulator
MSQPSQNVSLRITEDNLRDLESRVGLDGARNRSDVIRLAIHQYLQ